jgi:pilus assembly protein TadC
MVVAPVLAAVTVALLVRGVGSARGARRLAHLRRRVRRTRGARRSQSDAPDRPVAAQVPPALLADLLAGAVAAGALPAAALQAVVEALVLDAGDPLAMVSARLALGADPSVAWAPLLAHDGWRPLAVTMRRAATAGTQSADALRALASDLRDQRRAAATEAARAASVRAVLPLGTCFLPAFVLLGIVPALVGLASSVLANS